MKVYGELLKLLIEYIIKKMYKNLKVARFEPTPLWSEIFLGPKGGITL